MLYNTKEDDFENVIICTVQQIKEDEFSIIWFTDDKKIKSDFKNVAMKLKATIIDELCKPRHQNSNIIDDMQSQS